MKTVHPLTHSPLVAMGLLILTLLCPLVARADTATRTTDFFDLFADTEPVIPQARSHNPQDFIPPYLDSIVQPHTGYIISFSKVTLNGVSKEALFEFTSNVLNDPLWYPGVISVSLISGDGGLGSLYEETLFFGTTTVEITGFIRKTLAIEKSRGLVSSTGLLAWEGGSDASTFKLWGLVELNPILTPEKLAEFNRQAMTNLIVHFGTTGTIENWARQVQIE